MSRWHHIKTKFLKTEFSKTGLLWFGLLTPIVLYASTVWRRPSPVIIERQPLFQGITYSRQASQQPRPHIVHTFDIDLTAPGLRPYVTPTYFAIDLQQYLKHRRLKSRKPRAKRTSEFLKTHKLQLAVNANFFIPFNDGTPWYYQPGSGDVVNLNGLSISNGDIVAGVNPENKPSPPALCFTEQQAVISDDGTCAEGTRQAIAGNLVLLEDGQPTEWLQNQLHQEGEIPYSFTIAALDATGTRLWLVLVDGKQPLYSEGMTLGEVTAQVQALGADTAVRLDGGGSTTAVISSPHGATVLNTPIHSKIPGRERPVGNHLGFFAKPLVP